MGIILRSNIDASGKATKAATSVTSGLKLMGFFDSTIDKATRDFSTQSNALLTELGDVVVTPDHSQFHVENGYLDTDIPEPTDMTVFMVMKFDFTGSASAGDRGTCFSTFKGTSAGQGGYHMGYQIDGDIGFGVALDDAGSISMNAVRAPFSDHTVWRLVAATYDDATKTVRVQSPADSFDESSTGTGNIAHTAETFRVGSQPADFSQLGPSNISQLRYYDRVLTDAEINEVFEEMRTYESGHNGRTV